MKNDISIQSIKSNEKNKKKMDKTLYEKLLILGDKEVYKSSLVQNIFPNESISIVFDNSILSLSATNNNTNNEPSKKIIIMMTIIQMIQKMQKIIAWIQKIITK